MDGGRAIGLFLACGPIPNVLDPRDNRLLAVRHDWFAVVLDPPSSGGLTPFGRSLLG